MKKIALSLAVVATLAMVSCGNKAETTDSDTTNAVDTPTMVEPVVADTNTDTANKADEAKVEEAAAPAKDTAKAKETKAEEPKK